MFFLINTTTQWHNLKVSSHLVVCEQMEKDSRYTRRKMLWGENLKGKSLGPRSDRVGDQEVYIDELEGQMYSIEELRGQEVNIEVLRNQ